METWNLFTGNDIFLGLLGAAGFLSMIAVIFTGSQRMNKREELIRQARLQKQIESLEETES